MAKEKNNELLPTLAGVFCLFVTFLYCMSLFSSFSFWALMVPALWLLLGLCLMTKKIGWLTLVGLLPVTILKIQSAWYAIPLDSLQGFAQAMVCRVLPVLGYVFLFTLMLLYCLRLARKMRRDLWFLPILLVLPWCVWQYGATLPWAEFGMIACVTVWIKPAKK